MKLYAILALQPLVLGTGVLALGSAWKRSDPQPLSIPPSNSWDGNDGNWSTFGLQIGTPPQPIRTYFSTTQNAVWAVLPQGCDANSTANCTNERGLIYNPPSSTSFIREDSQYWTLQFDDAATLGYSGGAEVGLDNVTLGLPGSGMPELNSTMVEAFKVNFPYLGILGLSPQEIYLQSQNAYYPSILTTLRAQGLIPSMSWAYTAGAVYQSTFGSLTIGGYDSNRQSNPVVKIPFGDAGINNLTIAVQSITANDAQSSALLPNQIYAFIDSTVSTMWLPVEACQQFANLFNLTWYEEDNMYFIDETMHNSLLASNYTLTFAIGSTLNSTAPVEIRFPYASFDLIAEYPITPIGYPTRYFPIQNATNSSQYIFGRTFLQEAYIVVNYDTSELTIAQALFPASGTSPNIVAIIDQAGISNTPNTPNTPVKKTGLSAGAIAGIVIGAVAVIAAIIAIIWCMRRRKKKQAVEQAVKWSDEKAQQEQEQLFHEQQHEDAGPVYPELSGGAIPAGMVLPGKHAIFPELPSPDPSDARGRHEIGGRPVLSELPSWQGEHPETPSRIESPVGRHELSHERHGIHERFSELPGDSGRATPTVP